MNGLRARNITPFLYWAPISANIAISKVVAGTPAHVGLFRLDQLVAALASQRLWITDAYFVPIAPYVEALRAAARSTPLSCTIQDEGVGRHSQEIESAVYFACIGALANVGPEATRIVITLRADDRLRFEVRDDDPGPPPHDPEQAWLDEPLDRLAAVAGELAVEAVPGEGTRVTGSVPLR
jgi:hypothetical protein